MATITTATFAPTDEGMETVTAEPADSVWLLMGKEYRISRSIRLQWFFQHLKQVVTPKSDDEIVNSTEELEVLSILPTNRHTFNGGPLSIATTTKLPFIGRQYRFVFCIDMSPSLATVDTETGNVLFDDMFENLRNSLTGLVQPFHIPGSLIEMTPTLHVTVLAHIDVNECRVLVQGYCVNKGNVKHFLCKLKKKLVVLEDQIADDLASCNMNGGAPGGAGVPGVGGWAGESLKQRKTGLFFMIRDGLVALQLLPDNASAGIVVITDGVFILDNALITDALLAQVRTFSAVLSFLQVGTGYRRASVDFGYVPHCALMQFIATTTSGAYLATCPPVKEKKGGMNLYHKALYCLHFQRDIDRHKIDSSHSGAEVETSLPHWTDYFDCLAPYKEIPVTTPPQPRQTMRYVGFNIKTRITSVLTVRLREGYIADGIQLTKDETMIEVKLVWPWKEHISIEYIARAAWPLDTSRNEALTCSERFEKKARGDDPGYLTHIVVNVSGPYEFLVDITSAKPQNHKLYRKTVLQRFDQTMKSLDMSDQLLVQLQLFPIHPAASKIPDTIVKGSPLFFMPPGTNTPIIALQYGSKPKKSSKSPDVQFANFWKSVVTMDTTTWRNTNTWAKWWHIHRINLLPEHNRPVTKDLFLPSSTNHYPAVNCRTAFSKLMDLLREWCSFVLLENHSYVKFMTKPGADRPHTFCLLRLTSRGSCIGIRWAFLAGTPGEERFEVFEKLKEQLMNLTAPIYKISFSEDNLLKDSKPPESKCLIILTKQVERILVKYDSIPDDVRFCGHPSADISILNVTLPITDTPMGQYSALQQETQKSPGQVLSQYLFNQRWVWCMRGGENAALDGANIAHMLDAILKQRLHEGFHFWICNKGIISLVKEVDVMVDSSEGNMSNCCVIQYVLFPPHQQTTTQSNAQDDSVESDGLPEPEEDMQMVVEVWVEPQFGTMDVVKCPLDYINGCEYHEVPAKMFEVDAQIVTEISSYMLIHHTCLRKDVTDCFPTIDTVRPTIPRNVFQPKSIVRVPFLFEIVALLRKSRLILSVYPMMKEVSQPPTRESEHNMNDILLSFINDTLASMNDCEVTLRPKEKKLIHEYLLERCAGTDKLWVLEGAELIFNQGYDETRGGVELKCFIKSFGMRLVIVILPASMKDLEVLVSSGGNVTSVGHKCRNFPFFVFECEYPTVQSISSVPPSHEQDILQDYTRALTESALTPRHFNQKLPEDRSRDIAVYCQALYDHYFWALVSGVYKCLQNGFKLDPDDVELSIDLVCEESIKEIDLTEFLMTTCKHYNDMMNSNYVFSNNDADVLYDSFNAGDSYGGGLLNPHHHHHHHHHRSHSQSLKKTMSNESGRSVRSTPRKRTSVCENVMLQADIQRQFQDILERYFQSIPGDSYSLFFKDDSLLDGTTIHESSMHSRNTSDSLHGDATPSSEEIDLEAEFQELEILPAIDSKRGRDYQRPMFLHLTCSCHYRSTMGKTMSPISVKSIPTCLCDITNKLDDCVTDLDPCNPLLSIKLTLICLTQPPEPEQDDEWNTPSKIVLTRQNSAESAQSQESDRQKRNIMTQQSDDSFINTDSSNFFTQLPMKQQRALDNIIADVKWLLQDEISSALRLHIPLSEESLENVATHVMNSKKSNCIYETRYFMFLTATDKATDLCLPLFVTEVESTMLGKYKLTRVGKYWCVVLSAYNRFESESESRVAMFEEVKEKAKLTRKGMGHRRSQSDYTDNRLPKQDHLDVADFTAGVSRTASLPAISIQENKAADDQSNDQDGRSGFHPLSCGPLWQTDGTTGGIVRGGRGAAVSQPIRISEEGSSQSGSSDSLAHEDDRELRRSVSYTEEKMFCETQRRSFSLSDIYRPGSSCDGMSGLNIHRPFTDNDACESTSSNTDYGEKYSNDSSEFEEERSLRPHPHFWLFMQITEESVFVYLHRRRAEQQNNIKHQKGVYQRLLESLDRICKIVNQQILLDQLYTSQHCHNLLLPEDEDQEWNNSQDQSTSDIMVVKKHGANTTPFSAVVHGESRFKQGFFECDMVWEERIPIHNRLRVSNRAGKCSNALMAVRSVLNKFRVQNRQNLFVIKDKENIFYFRVNEGTNENDYTRGNMSPPPDEDHYLFTPVKEDLAQQSRASSISSLVRNEENTADAYDRYNYERQESYHSGQFHSKASDDKCSISETSSHVHHVQDYLHFCVYGIREPGKEIKEELVKMMKKKLDSTTMDIINHTLQRNLKCRLSPQDVEFIQPVGEPPSRVLTLCVSNFASKYLHATIFYLHQYLLDKYCNPRYTSDHSECYFKNYRTPPNNTECIDVNDVYLYNRRERYGPYGKYGIAIAYLALVDQLGNKVIAQPTDPELNLTEGSTQDHMDTLKKLVMLKRKEDLKADDETEMCQSTFIQFNIWICGDIDLNAFEKELTENTSYALYDVFLEYHFLCTPICSIPNDLLASSDSSRRESVQRSSFGRSMMHSGNSSAATTPKLLKTHPTLKKFSSEPTTPSDMRRESPQNLKANISKDDLSLVSESPRSFPQVSTPDEAERKRYSLQETRQDPNPKKDMLGDDPDQKKILLPENRHSPNLRKDTLVEDHFSAKRYSYQEPKLNTSQRKETFLDDPEKKRYSLQESRHSPLPRKDNNRDCSPLNRQGSTGSKGSVHHLEYDNSLTPRKTSRIETQTVDVSNQPKTIKLSELNQMKDSKDATYVMLTDAEVHESLKAVTDVEHDVGGGSIHDNKLNSTWQEIEMQRRMELDKKKRRRMLEHGAVGDLHPNYFECCAAIFDHVIAAGHQSVYKQEGVLTHQYMIETVMKEFKKEMEERSPDMNPKVFKEAKRFPEHEATIYVQYFSNSFKASEDSTSDTASNTSSAYPSFIPGEVKSFIVIGHNAHKWLLSMGSSEADLADDEEGKNTQEELSKQKFRPFIPLNASSSGERRKVNDIQPPSCIVPLFVPRQKFFMALFNQKKISLYTYNYSSDVTAALDKQLRRLYAWQNVRTHLNSCLFLQKLGLYHHKHFVRDCPGKDDQDVALFASSTYNLQPLMKEVAPKAKDRNKQERARNLNIAEFDEVFRNTAPSKVLHSATYFLTKDVVKRQAHQYQDVRNIKLQRHSTEGRLKEIFEAWKETGRAIVPIAEDRLSLLKKHSRLHHYCSAPIFFDVDQEEDDICEEEPTPVSKKGFRFGNDVKGSPHSLDESENSGVLGTLDWQKELLLQYIQYLQTRGLNLVQLTNKGPRHVPTSRTRVSSLRSSRLSSRAMDGKDIIISEEHQSRYYLQKTLLAGIILIEVFFEKNYLCYNMSAFESVSLKDFSGCVSIKDQRNFFEDCGKFKDLTYIRSFTYDYHIRQIHLHLCGRHSIFPKGYPVHTLMERILSQYPTPPRYSTCIVTKGSIEQVNTNRIVQNTVFDYLITNSARYLLSKIVVSKSSHDDIDCLDPSDYILTYSHIAKKIPIAQEEAIFRNRRENNIREFIEYDGNVALQFQAPGDEDDCEKSGELITWPFFLVLVNRVEFYPRASYNPNKNRSKDFSADPSINETEYTVQRPRFNQRPSNTTGSLKALQHSISQTIRFSPKDVSLSPDAARNMLSHSSESEYSFSVVNSSQSSAMPPFSGQQEFLINELKFVGDEITRVQDKLNMDVRTCLRHCYRDLGWNALLISDTVLEDDSLTKKLKKKSSAQSFETSSLITLINEWKSEKQMDMIPNMNIGPLTFDHITVLLELVTCYKVSDIDKRISAQFAFIQPGNQQKVLKTLNARYGSFCRQFLSDDGDTTLLCIINPRHLDMMVIAVADEKGKRMEFSAVYRTPPLTTPLQPTHYDTLTTREKCARDHIENVITCLCYDIWLQLLPT